MALIAGIFSTQYALLIECMGPNVLAMHACMETQAKGIGFIFLGDSLKILPTFILFD